MEMWPPSAKLYEVIGLAQKKEYSLLIDNIQPTAEKDGDKTILVVTGDITNTNNSYGSISDEKLKENIADASSQWDDIKALKVRKFSFKTDKSLLSLIQS